MFFTEAETKAVRVAERGDAVHKDECAYCFNGPADRGGGGLYVCLSDHLSFCAGEHADLHWEKTNHTLYLRIVRTRRLRQQKGDDDDEQQQPPPQKRPTVLGVGVPGGFASDADKYDVEEAFALVRLPTARELPLRVTLGGDGDGGAGGAAAVVAADGAEIPEAIAAAVLSVVRAEGQAHRAQVEEFNATELAGPLPVSKVAESLVQLPRREGDAGAAPPPGGWVCEHPGCGLRSNLWLNLTDGVVMCGRGNFVGLGNGHALEHYRATGHPLAVKLGTLTADEAEVYSYSEDDSVLDPQLAKHLLHFGIDRSAIHEKTDKTLAELTVDVNNRFEFERLTEKGKPVVHAFGPGRTGLRNLGNSCYLSATMQALFSLPPFVDRYANPGIVAGIIRDSAPDASGSLQLQLSKLGLALCSGKYSVPAPEAEGETLDPNRGQLGIPPRALKTLLGRANHVFATSHQQDALEFLQFLLGETEKAERSAGMTAEQCVAAQFRMQIEERLECGATHHVRYTWRPDNVLSLPIPLDRATNIAEVTASEFSRSMITDPKQLLEHQPVRPNVPLDACLAAWLEQERIDGWRSPETGAMTFALKTSRIAVFPSFLVVQLRRYVPGGAAEGWQPKKLDALVSMPDFLDLEGFRSVGGLQEAEEPLVDSGAASGSAPSAGAPSASSGSGSAAAGAEDADPMIVASLESMGFPEFRARKAAVMTGNRSTDAATEWLLAHMDDSDEALERAAPMPAPRAPPPPPTGDVPPEVEMLCSMGFSERHVRHALEECSNDVSRAADWLLSHAEELAAEMDVDAAMQQQQQPASAGRPVAKFPRNEGPARYELVAIVSHIGRTTQSGHYVAHIRKDGKWLLFNDESVTISEDPPRDLGFLHFYRRI